MSSSVASVAAGFGPLHAGTATRSCTRPRFGRFEGRPFQAALDDAARHVIELACKVRRGRQVSYSCDYERHADVAYKAACESAVLLENDGILPLKGTESVAVVDRSRFSLDIRGPGLRRSTPSILMTPGALWRMRASKFPTRRVTIR